MTKSLKDTLNLPNTNFSMKAGLPIKEPKIIDFWIKSDIYGKLRKKNKGKKLFLLHDGPPYANGPIHLGHSVNKILKDITIKSKGLLGYDAPYVPGWDCHGLPIELNVEKKYGKKSDTVSNKKLFQKACKDYAISQINNQKKDFIRLGVFGDWDNPYLSLNTTFEANVVRILGKIFQKGHLEKGEKPVHWCQDCGSALAEAEVEYQDKTSKSIDVKFKISDDSIKKVKNLFDLKDSEDAIYFVIWTTTPWTLPSNVAVCLNKNLEYSLVEDNNKLLIIASDMRDECSKRWSKDLNVISKYQGDELLGTKLNHPFLDRESIVIHGDHVTTEAGTGCVHTAPAHGLDDFNICKKNNIDMIKALDSNGLFKKEIEFLHGLPTIKADTIIIDKLEEFDSLIYCEDYIHSYPHCWRHKTPLIFTATPQWFISMNKGNLLEQAEKSIKNVNWEPSWGEQRIESMLNERPDWCISRQRSWGVPITLLIHKDSGEIHSEQEHIFEKVAKLIEKSGISAWDEINIDTLIDNSEDYIKIKDTLDVWFDSGVTHFAVTNKIFGEKTIADLYLEGSDQHRGWFQSSLLTSIAINKTPPYKSVLTHGFVVDEDGRKQSKSLGNVVSPQRVWDTLGADILRLWVASTDFRSEMVASDEVLKRVSDQYRRIRNTFRFLLGNLYDYSLKNQIKYSNLVEIDKWIIQATSDLEKEVINLYENYSYHIAIQKIHNFCVNELGGIYLDVIKDRLYTCGKDSHARRSSQTSIDFILNTLVRLIAPVLSFTAEEIWKEITSSKEEVSVFLSHYLKKDLELNSNLTINDWSKIFNVKDKVNRAIEEARNSSVIKGSLDAVAKIFLDEEEFSLLSRIEDELHFLFIVSEAYIYKSKTFKVEIIESNEEKCDRCWHRNSSVKNSSIGNICSRCNENVFKNGEKRSFV